jgi:hypothetical protein
LAKTTNQNTMKNLLLFIAAVAMVGSAHGRVGDTPEQLANHYPGLDFKAIDLGKNEAGADGVQLPGKDSRTSIGS